MKKTFFAIMMVMMWVTQVQAGPHATALSQCLLSNTTDRDKAVMTKWVFASLSNHPSLNNMASIAQNVRTGTDQDMARLVEKFMYESCSAELKNAVKNEGPSAIQTSIRSYVEVTGREILQHPSVANSVTGLASQLDAKKMFEALMSN